jgi:predicted RNA-binding protein with RPS1 domain
MQIPTDKIREVIGSGGKVIREIVEVSGAKVDINDDGIIKIASPNGEAIQKAYDMIHSIVAEPEEGKIYKGTVVKIVDFGAFVNFFGKRDGLVHVSQIENRRLNHPSDVLKEGQEVWVKLLGFDDRGKVRLSMKMVDQETGEEMKKEELEALRAIRRWHAGWSGEPVGRAGALPLRRWTRHVPAHPWHAAALVDRHLGLIRLCPDGQRTHHGHVRRRGTGRDGASLSARLRKGSDSRARFSRHGREILTLS